MKDNRFAATEPVGSIDRDETGSILYRLTFKDVNDIASLRCEHFVAETGSLNFFRLVFRPDSEDETTISFTWPKDLQSLALFCKAVSEAWARGHACDEEFIRRIAPMRSCFEDVQKKVAEIKAKSAFAKSKIEGEA